MNCTKSRKVFLTGLRVVQTLAPAKRKWQIISSLLVVLFLGSNAQAGTRDWQAVKNLQPGARIIVKTQHRYPCIFVSATEDELFCDVPRHWRLGLPAGMTFSRREIREVRKLPNQAKDAWIGAGIGAGAGAIMAGAGSRTYPGPMRFLAGSPERAPARLLGQWFQSFSWCLMAAANLSTGHR